MSIQALQKRGVQFLSCHTATEEQVKELVGRYSLKASAEETVQDLQAHILSGVLIVPSMVASILRRGLSSTLRATLPIT